MTTTQLDENTSDTRTYQNEMRRSAPVQSDSSFMDLAEIIGDKAYQSETGQICYLDGATIAVSEAVSTLSADRGMQHIADRVVEQLG